MKNLIIGAGPAGIQLGFFFQQSGDEYLIVDKAEEACSFFKYYPRQRRFISFNKRRDLRYDWNSFAGSDMSMRDYSDDLYPHVDDYLRYVKDFLERYKLNIRYNYEITKIEKKDGVFLINDGEIEAERVFYGCGMKPKPIPEKPVHESIVQYTYANMPLDPNIYREKIVLVMGTGNSGLETANWLAPFTDKTIIYGENKEAWHSHFPGDQRQKNLDIQDQYFLKMRTHIVPVKDYFKTEDTVQYGRIIKPALETGRHFMMGKVDIVIWCHGFTFEPGPIKDLIKVGKFPLLTPNFESTITPGLFCIGSITQQHDMRIGTSSFIPGYRSNIEYLHKYLTGSIRIEKFVKRRDLVNRIFDQLTHSHILFHRFNYFCDIVGFTDGYYEYIHEVPIAAVNQFIKTEWKKFFTVKLAYHLEIKEHAWFFPKVSLWSTAHMSRVIHPMLTMNNGYVHHIPEDPYNEWILGTTSDYPPMIMMFLKLLHEEITPDEFHAYKIDVDIKKDLKRRSVI
jgi:thioredoxin reductase